MDIYTVKEFLGHASLAMTEHYVKIYLSSLKAKYDAYRVKKQQTYATEMMATQIQISQKERGLTPRSSGLYTQNKTTFRARAFCESEFEDGPALLTPRQADS